MGLNIESSNIMPSFFQLITDENYFENIPYVFWCSKIFPNSFPLNRIKRQKVFTYTVFIYYYISVYRMCFPCLQVFHWAQGWWFLHLHSRKL